MANTATVPATAVGKTAAAAGQAVTWLGARLVNIGLTIFFPFIMMAVGYYMFPESRALVSWKYSTEVSTSVVAQLLIGGGWLAFNFYPVIRGNARTAFLQTEAAISVLTGIVVAAYGGYLFGLGLIAYWFVVPCGIALADAVFTTVLAINNAAQLSTKGRDQGAVGVTAA